MNKVIVMGRLTRNPEIKYSQNVAEAIAIAHYTLAVDRRNSKKNDDPNAQTADFLQITAFGKSAEFAEKYFTKGMKVIVTGRLQTGSYTNKDGVKVYTTDIIAEDQEFAESKQANDAYRAQAPVAPVQQQGYAQPQGYGAPVQQQGYGAPVQKQGYAQPQGYGAPAQQYGAPNPVGNPVAPAPQPQTYGAPMPPNDGWMNIPEGAGADYGLPFAD